MNVHWMSFDVRKEDAIEAARLHAKRGAHADAEYIYGAMLLSWQDDGAIWLEAGEIAAAVGDLELACERFRHAVNCGEADIAMRGLNLLGKALLESGQMKEAAQAWFELTRYNLKSKEAWAGLTVCGFVTGRNRLAKKAQKRLMKCASQSTRRKLLAELWAYATAHRASQIGQSISHSKSILGDLVADACNTLGRARSEYPMRADVHFHYASANRWLGEKVKAMRAIEDAVAINERYKASLALKEALQLAA
ncbi:hypothetical protein KS4_27230 [Poriferisphaera corsica]|uniref:Tetratricopeptide repeat protein n=1 Tax=Poriferisphaera corsica TaxID=2528020 RepID=A0A517YWR5_9BACT|nr:hypothetical protein [Poriferisphaera corsica]QDU34652.1 hypothetical protein KS4_27230 [Poriferisphaera corsica]